MTDSANKVATPEAEADVQAEAEAQAELQAEINRLTAELDAIKKQSKDITIGITGAANNPNYKKFKSEAILSLNVPNSLFLLWNKRNKLEYKLGSAETSLISINAASTTLKQRLKNKQSRFLVDYRKASGSRQKKLHAQCTNMILLEGEVIPCNTHS